LKLLRELIPLVFKTSKRGLKLISIENPDWAASIAISNFVSVNTEDDNWDEVDTTESILDDAFERGDDTYIEKYYEDMFKSLEKMKAIAKGDLFVYRDKSKNGNRNFFIANKQQQQEIIDFLLYLGWKKNYIEINPDWEKEMEELIDELEDMKQEAEAEAREMESMRRSSYRW